MLKNAQRAEAENYYRTEASTLLRLYEQVQFEDVHHNLLPYMPRVPTQALDVGAGSGRDAAWLAARGWHVTAVEPSSELRAGGRKLHPSARIRWIDDTLPDLTQVKRLGHRYSLIMMSAVWMHVAEQDEAEALTTLASLSSPESLTAITVRSGGDTARRGFHDSDIPRLLRRAAEAGFIMLADSVTSDALGRPDIRWRHFVLGRAS